MKNLKIILILNMMLLAACSSINSLHKPATKKKATYQQSATINQNDADYLGLILAAEQNSTGRVREILVQARKMTLFERTIIQGGCWDYLDVVWTRAGVSRQQRQVVFQSSKKGVYATPEQLRIGDWLYHINYEFNNIEHSGMFIGWVDRNKYLGVTLSYAGSNRREPARYRIYDLSGVYQITRAQ